MDVQEVVVVGLGTMGAGIAEVFARAGCTVVAIEVDPAALERGVATLDRSLTKAVERGKLAAGDKAEILARVRPAGSLDAASGADLVVEVVPERLEIKRQVFAELDRVCRPETILATNTSSLSVTEIAAGTRHPGRIVGLHFFNPAPIMRLVEVITTVLTDPGTGQAVTDLAKRLGKTAVQVTDRAGFVANALLLPYLNHAVRLLEAGYATREDIDTAVTAGIGLPMGPLTLLDLIGLDTSLSILDVLHAEFGGTRFTAAPLLRRLAAAGLTGRKAGRGFYDYSARPVQGSPSLSPMGNGDRAPAPVPVMLVGTGDDGTARLAEQIEQAGWPVTIVYSTARRAAARMPGARLAGPAPASSAHEGSAHEGSAHEGSAHEGSAHEGSAHEGSGLAGPGSARAGTAGFGSAGSGSAGSGRAGSGPAVAGGETRLILIEAADGGPGVLPDALAAGPADAVGLHLISGVLAGSTLAELITTPLSAPAAVAAARHLAGRLGMTVVQCQDRAGFLAGALLYPHLNDAVAMVQDGYATAAGIDTAMTLGCGYPRGPMEVLDLAGPARAVAVLSRMHRQFGDPAFMPVPLLAEYAAAGLTFR